MIFLISQGSPNYPLPIVEEYSEPFSSAVNSSMRLERFSDKITEKISEGHRRGTAEVVLTKPLVL